MAQGPLDKLVKLRQIRAQRAARELASLRVSKTKLEAGRHVEQQRLQSHIQHYTQTELGFQNGSVTSVAGFAAVQGDLMAIRQRIQSSQTNMESLGQQLVQIEKRIVEARKFWRNCENAHDRFVELTGEIKKRELMSALATEEFMDS